MNHNHDQLRLDLIAVRYLEAAEHGDLDTIADLWAAAAADPGVETLLHELNEELTRAPRSRRRRVWIGLAAAGVAACVAALIWLAGEREGTKVEKADPSIQPVSVPLSQSPSVPGPAHAALVSHSSRFALLRADVEGGEMPAFDWPFSELPMIKGSSAIPADLLN
jgi:hypothetical protein